jgi:hypothetical protein
MNDERDPENRAICVVLVLSMSPVVAASVIDGRAFDGGSAVSLLLLGLGLIGLLQQSRALPALPRARARRSRLRKKGSLPP